MESYFEQKSNELGFHFDFLEKTYHIAKIIKAISENSLLLNNLTLKGGTAINLFWGGFIRLSIDIDLDFTGALPKDSMDALRDPLIEKIKEIGSELGYSVKQRPPSYIIRGFSFKYRPIRRQSDRIKIELNFLNRIPIISRIKRNFHNIFSEKLGDFGLYTYTIEELIAMKTEAFLNRKFSRDLFDIYSLIKMKNDINYFLVKKATLLYLCMSPTIISFTKHIEDFKGFMEQFISLISNISEKEFKYEVGNFLSTKFAITWEEIKNDLIEFYLKNFNLKSNENDFWKSFFLKNKYNPALLSEGKNELNKDIDKHPSILHITEKRSSSTKSY